MVKRISTNHPLKIIKKEIYITEFDRVTHVRGVSNEGQVLSVINVSYEIKIRNSWVTIIRFDSAHGFLHRHTKFSLKNSLEVVERKNVKQKGDPYSWYTWAIQDIQKNFLNYRSKFTRRSNVANLGY